MKTLKWFQSNIGKRIFRDYLECCNSCNEIYKNVIPTITRCDPVLGVITSTTSKCLITKTDEQTKIPMSYDKYLLQLDNLCVSNNAISKSSLSYRPLPSH